MKLAADFREIARNALRGKWPVAVLTGFLASLMGALIFSNGGGSSGNSGDSNSVNISPADVQQWITLIYIVLAVLLIWLLVIVIIGGAGKLGYAIFNLKLVDGEQVKVSDLFSQFHRLGDGFLMNLLMAVYTFLWSLLLVIPGIIKSYSYSMTPYIMAEHPEMTVNEAITESRRIMDGNKFRLFCLGFSFIGWGLLCMLPMVIAMAIIITRMSVTGDITTLLWLIPCGIPSFVGSLFLVPYEQAAFAAFYRDVEDTRMQPIPENGDPWTTVD